MSRYLAFKFDGDVNAEWYFSDFKPLDAHVEIPISLVWDNALGVRDHYASLHIENNVITSVAIVSKQHKRVKTNIYVSLQDLFEDQTGYLPTQPLED